MQESQPLTFSFASYPALKFRQPVILLTMNLSMPKGFHIESPAVGSYHAPPGNSSRRPCLGETQSPRFNTVQSFISSTMSSLGMAVQSVPRHRLSRWSLALPCTCSYMQPT